MDESGGAHIAVNPSGPGAAPPYRSGGSSFVGLNVRSMERIMAAVRAIGAEIVQEPDDYPRGLRALVRDPDGRVVELNQMRGTT